MEMERIDLTAEGALERWAAQLAVTPEALRDAIRAIGTDVDKVKGYLAAHVPPAAPAVKR